MLQRFHSKIISDSNDVRQCSSEGLKILQHKALQVLKLGQKRVNCNGTVILTGVAWGQISVDAGDRKEFEAAHLLWNEPSPNIELRFLVE